MRVGHLYNFADLGSRSLFFATPDTSARGRHLTITGINFLYKILAS
jgi:hypothetical protein